MLMYPHYHMNITAEGLKMQMKDAWLFFYFSADILVQETKFFLCQFLKSCSGGFKSTLI